MEATAVQQPTRVVRKIQPTVDTAKQLTLYCKTRTKAIQLLPIWI